MPVLKKLSLYMLLLLCSFKLCAQSQPVKNYKLFFEKVYLHTDRELYSGGDDIWYKAYLVNAQNNQPIGSSNNLYVELISAQAEIISRQIIRLDYGLGNGDIKLSDSIPTGKYRLRAYTNWMRNFGDNFVFEKNIDIVTPGSKTPAETKPVVITNNLVVRFYSEGGSLIEGVSSIVAVKAEDAQGRGLSLMGTIFNSSNDTLSRFTCDSLGMGLFTLLPLSGQSYRAEMVQNQQIIKTELPQALLNGINLSVVKNDTLIYTVVNLSDAALSQYINHRFVLSGKHGGSTYFRQAFQITGSQLSLKIPNDFFPEGIASLTLYDDQDKPHSERLIYIHHPEKETQLSLTTDKPVYQPRDKVTVKLKLNDATSNANLSMAVVDESVSPVPAENINSYLMLQSELKGNITYPARYFDTTNVNRFKQLDQLLLTQGWRDFVWRRVADSAIRLSYAVENGFNITGKVRQKLADKPIAGMNITLTAFKARGQKLYSAKTDSTGRYYIPDVQLYGAQPISLTARNNKGDRAGWLLMDSLSREPSPVPAQPKFVLDTNVYIIKALKQREVNIKKAANSRTLKEVKITDKKPVVLRDMVGQPFGYPDQTFTITKKDEYYESLENWMAHNLKGAVTNGNPGVMFAGQGGDTYLPSGLMYPQFIVNGEEIVPTAGTYFEIHPGMLRLQSSDVDIQMKDAMRQTYYDLTMDKVKRVELRHLIGIDPDLAKTIDIYALYLNVTPDAFENKDFGLEKADVSGYYETRTFYKPIYDAQSDLKKPDLRTTIHWEPNVSINKNGEATITFYNADPKSKIRLIVEGITDKGVPVVANSSYEVK